MLRFWVLLILISCDKATSFLNGYKVGVGRADCTGPSVEVTFMGYAQLSQKGEGIHLRQFSRAFIVDDGYQRIVFVSVDAGMMGIAIKRKVIQTLQSSFADLYTFDNVIISGTHTHGCPGGFLTHLLYDLPSLGFVQETFDALVNGIVNSIIRAHDNIVNGRLFFSEIEIQDANINRSPTSYLNNPEEERTQYKYDVDKTMVQIRFLSTDNKLLGAINWFAVHPTSMNNTNRLVSSDNVGYASILLEQEHNPGQLPGKGDFVGAFASSNLGDVSPNIMGPKCQFSGESCDLMTSSCPIKEGQCFSSGPGSDMFESTKIIAYRLYFGASKLLKKMEGKEMIGPIQFIHQYVNMPEAEATYFNIKTKTVEQVQGCLPAMGYSFAAGTTDGPGAFDFRQGTTSSNPLWNIARDFIAEPKLSDIECHKSKPILLATGRATFPYEWQPKIVATQTVRIGDVILAAVPGEFTTMSGRRLKNSIRNAVLQVGGDDVQVIICGLSNMYTSYITTPEEYNMQRYEAASTIYGPHTLTIYIDQFSKLVQAMIKNETLDAGPSPPNLENNGLISLQTGIVFDGHPFGLDFGSVRVQPEQNYKVGDTVSALFVAANPRNNLLHEKTYLTVEHQRPDGDWDIIASDANWETFFQWKRVSIILGLSDVEVRWNIPERTEPGIYRIRHFGFYSFILGGTFPYEGTTNTFSIRQH